MQFGLLVHRVRVYPGICASTDTLIDIYLDSCEDLALHPLYSQRETPFQANGQDKQRHRSMPVHRLVQEMHSHLNLEPDSLATQEEVQRGNHASRPNVELEVSHLVPEEAVSDNPRCEFHYFYFNIYS